MLPSEDDAGRVKACLLQVMEDAMPGVLTGAVSPEMQAVVDAPEAEAEVVKVYTARCPKCGDELTGPTVNKKRTCPRCKQHGGETVSLVHEPDAAPTVKFNTWRRRDQGAKRPAQRGRSGRRGARRPTSVGRARWCWSPFSRRTSTPACGPTSSTSWTRSGGTTRCWGSATSRGGAPECSAVHLRLRRGAAGRPAAGGGVPAHALHAGHRARDDEHAARAAPPSPARRAS